jgi:hydroxyacylglutathione hydrolase
MREIFPSIHLLRPDKAPAKSQFPYLICRPDGNYLLATKDDISAYFPAIERFGGVSKAFLGDRHHASEHTASSASQLGATLTSSDVEAKVLRDSNIVIDQALPLKRQQFSPDLEIIPTPGHTRGAFSYLWSSPQGRKFLFVGDTIVPINGIWHFYITKPQKEVMRRTIELMATLDFDVILSNSFAAAPRAWVEVDARSRAAVFADILKRLK